MSLPRWPGWVVFHLPRDATAIPKDVREQFLVSEAALANEIAQRTAHCSFELFASTAPEHQVVRAAVSPLVLDFEPLELGELRPTTAFGQVAGATLDTTRLRRELTALEREQLLDDFHYPQQAWFATKVALAIAAYGRCLVVNGGSFAASEPSFDIDERLAPLPEVRLGTDPDHTPKGVLEAFSTALQAAGWSVQVARAHERALVPAQHYRLDRRVHCVAVELNQKLYWDPSSGRVHRHFESVQQQLARALGSALQRLS